MSENMESRAEAIFKEVVDLPIRARDTAIAEKCAGDAELLKQVRSLVDALDDAGEFLAGPTLSPQEPQPDGPGPGTIIGSYKILQEIGQGGFGVVYMAEQFKPVKRRVALKVIKLGMDTKEVIARFDAERQALAIMDHANIARVFDAGSTESGRPYFVMELVNGVPITTYCDTNHLTPRQRLELMVPVCQAVHSAHQKGVIHRDLKPSNVMVTLHDGKPVPKVIDFGIAKATAGSLTDKTLFTAFQQFIGTPAYMSPEQAEMTGLDIDTRADVYGLGVLLYELLTGTTPVDPKALKAAAFAEVARLIRESEPSKPSTKLSTLGGTLTGVAASRGTDGKKLSQIVRGELDWIVMKALEKDRNRRYDSAAALADDLDRCLKGEAVSAGPPGGFYRFRKFARRNKRVIGFAVIVIIILLVGVAGLSVGLVREAAQRRIADEKVAIASAVEEFQLQMLEAADPGQLLGDKVTVLQATNATIKKLDEGQLRNQPAVEAGMRNVIGRTLESLGQFHEAEIQLREALRLRKMIAGSKDDLDVAESANNLGLDLQMQGMTPEAEQQFRDALAIDEKVSGKNAPALVVVLDNLASVMIDRNKIADAEAPARRALQIARAKPPHPNLAETLNILATVLQQSKRPPAEQARAETEAESLFREAVAVTRSTPGHDLEAGDALNNLGTLLIHQKRYVEAEPFLRDALKIESRVLPANHPSLVSFNNNLAFALQAEGKSVEAEPIYREALRIARLQTSDSRADAAVARTLSGLASAIENIGKRDEAISCLQEALSIYQKRLRPEARLTASTKQKLAAMIAARDRDRAATKPATRP